MEINSLGKTNFDTLFKAFNQAFADYEVQQSKAQLQTMLKRRGFDFAFSFGAFSQGEIVSFTCNGIGDFYGVKTAYDTGTGTLKEHRGKGLATRIFEYAIPHLKAAGIRQYLLEVLQHNTGAVSVYRKLGFEVTREFNYFVQENSAVRNELKMIDFPYTVGYGMTECGPIICYEDWRRFKPGSCGKAVPRMDVQVLSSDPENIVGEIVCKGPNVMLGYYKNEEATKEVIDKDGWLHTGDLALKDAEGNITIKGRSKNLLLSASGQNIYPEEIEDKLNNLPYVAESIIVQQNEKLVGLVYPDFDDAFAHGLKNEDIERVMEENRVALNAMLPAYSQISKMKIYPEEFEKTPKKSIKRYLYQEAKG